jgi:multidrug efflux pump
LMGGIVGRMFREFAITLSVAVAISMVVSLTTTPMMCAKLLKPEDKRRKHNWIYRLSEGGFERVYEVYASSLRWVLDSTLTSSEPIRPLMWSPASSAGPIPLA